MPNARVNAAPRPGIVAADGHVVHSDQRGKQTYRRDQRERAVSGNPKANPDIRLARAPITIRCFVTGIYTVILIVIHWKRPMLRNRARKHPAERPRCPGSQILNRDG